MTVSPANRAYRHHLGTVQFIELILVAFISGLLLSIYMQYAVKYIDRAQLSEVFNDLSTRRLQVAEHLALRGDLPDTLVLGADYRFDRQDDNPTLSGRDGIDTRGFVTTRKLLQQKMMKTSSPTASEAEVTPGITANNKDTPPSTMAGLPVKTFGKPLQSYVNLEKTESLLTESSVYDSTQASGIYTEWQNFFLIGGSVFYLVGSFKSSPQAPPELLGFTLNSWSSMKSKAIWYTCGGHGEEVMGPKTQHDTIAAFEKTCTGNAQ